MAATRERIVNGSGQREHFAALFAGEPRRDQRAGLRTGLDDEHAERKPGDHAIAAREVRRPCFDAGGNSVTSAPCAAIRAASAVWRRG